jgi:putative hydrolase of the HAD superfamily
MLDAIAFDADDTLWHTETYYREVEHSFTGMLAAYGISTEDALAMFHRVEIDNLAYFGYGIRGFTLSMIETAIRITDEQVRGADIQSIIELGRGMTSHAIRLLEGVEETLAGLAGRRLLLITKGDALDQESKVRRSGLAGYFPSVEIVVDKTESVYAELLSRHAIEPGRFLMVGNSLRSDIAPVLALGSYAVHVPYALGWAHESAADLPADRSRFFQIASLRELPELIVRIEGNGKI